MTVLCGAAFIIANRAAKVKPRPEDAASEIIRPDKKAAHRLIRPSGGALFL